MPIFKDLAFKLTWRDYQDRILRELESQLDDDHLHIVAAPGSGKTILGIEVIRRLGRPCLVLAPTLTIRNQWIAHLVNLFLPDNTPPPAWISSDIRTPRPFTVITYQALYSAFSSSNKPPAALVIPDQPTQELEEKSEKASILEKLHQTQISTLVFDEAHHLRKEWWKALTELKSHISNAKTIALTATPPYDVTAREWQRYKDLCGPIDAEISVPELVKRGDLCPHQDYLHFSVPIKKEAESLVQFKEAFSLFLQQIRNDSEFLTILSEHPWLKEPENSIEEILEHPSFFSSMILFLHSSDVDLSDEVFELLGASRSSVPPLDTWWLEVLFTGVLYQYTEHFSAHDSKLASIRSELKRIGAIERRRVRINDSKLLQKLLTGSLGKLNSIVDITNAEAHHLGPALRQVILTDFIRKEELPGSETDTRPIEKLGAAPIFEFLRRAEVSGIKLGILTGSLIIVPTESRPYIEHQAKVLDIDPSHLKFKDLVYDKRFTRLNIKGEQKQKIVHLITEVFNAGHLNVLVGTQALLGEGWDAPSINTLILASNVGSYMLSNQMRGRAIRVDPNNPKKTANIWHLVSVDLHALEDKIQSIFDHRQSKTAAHSAEKNNRALGYDVDIIRRRFKAFAGLSYQEPVIIESGFDRLGLANTSWTTDTIEALNISTMHRAQARDQLQHLWEQALTGSTGFPRMQKIVESNVRPARHAYIETLDYFILNALIGGATWGVEVFRRLVSEFDLRWVILGSLGVAATYSLPRLIKASYLWIRNGTIDRSIGQVGKAIVDSLHYIDLIETPLEQLTVHAEKNNSGLVQCRLEGATNHEQRIFLKALEEILSPIENPRHILIRDTNIGPIQRVDYFAVPTVIGNRSQNAEYFHKKWKQYVGSSRLIFTRTIEGRHVLLRARIKAFSSGYEQKTDQLSVWR